MSTFSESQHPRVPPESEHGDEFASKFVPGVSGYSEPKHRYENEEELKSFTKKYFGKELGEKDLYEIAGILPGSKIKHILVQSSVTSGVVIEISSHVLKAAHPNPKSPSDLGGANIGFQTRSINLNTKIISNDSFFLNPDIQGGHALKALSIQVRAARAAGFNFIMTRAAGQGPGEDLRDLKAEGGKGAPPARGSEKLKGTVGYYVWPRLGFVPAASDGTVGAAGKSNIDLTKLMMTKEGRRWWKMNGTTNTLKFDLADGSISRRVFDAYVKEKGI